MPNLKPTSNFKPDDFIIVVMGPTGSGKTNFINKLIGAVEPDAARGIKSHTQDIAPYTIDHDGTRFILVDTPGFDDTFRPDIQILTLIANWLIQKNSGGEPVKVSGVIYLHRIIDVRMTGSTFKNLQMFGSLCGDLSLRRARIVTTWWDQVKDEKLADEKEAALKNDFWRGLIDAGAGVERFQNSKEAALNILQDLLSAKADRKLLLLQEELLRKRKRINETAAAQVIYSRLQELRKVQKNTLKELADVTKKGDVPFMAENLRNEYQKVHEELHKTSVQVKELKIKFPRRVRGRLFSRRTKSKAIKIELPTEPSRARLP